MGDTHISQDKATDVLFRFVVNNPELDSMLVQHAKRNATTIMTDILSDDVPEPIKTVRHGKLTYSQMRDCILEAIADHDQFTLNDLRQHPALNGLKASVLSQNLEVLRRQGKVKRTRQKIGKSGVWVKR
jgi:predicted HTH transcriptional regulator